MYRRPIGDMGESIAAQYLERKGFRIIDRNYLKPWGEIDIIAEKSGIIHFVEVKMELINPQGLWKRHQEVILLGIRVYCCTMRQFPL
ncbi:MAG: YraN family protein [Candidatus Kaiserbacteria bacterium]|nr:YraN family protein [Candidatus Kaiserbacteria bacterium]